MKCTCEFKLRLVAAPLKPCKERPGVGQLELLLFHSGFSLLHHKDGPALARKTCPLDTPLTFWKKSSWTNVRYVGVVKQGTLLWSILYPISLRHLFGSEMQHIGLWYHPDLSRKLYNSNQIDSKTIRLSPRKSILIGIGIIYGNGPCNFYEIEFKRLWLLTEVSAFGRVNCLLMTSTSKRSWNRTYVAKKGKW